MSSLDQLFQSLPMAQIAQQVGADERDVQQATAAILPALLGGLQANAQDPAGAASIEQALQRHDGSLLDGGVDVSQIDTQDGQAIASHIFGSNEDQVVARLGGLGGSGLDSPLVKKLLPILAPIVMAYLAKQVFGGTTTGQQQSSGGGVLGSILGSILGGGGLGGALGGGSAAGPEVPAQQPMPEPQGMPSMPAQTPGQTQPQTSGTGSIDDIINSAIDAGAPTGSGQAQQPAPQQQSGTGSILGSILGGLLGGGRR